MPNFKYKEGYYKFDPNDLFGHMQQEFPDESEFDVVIIGGGPNGLMAGAYLAKAGLSVCICERRYEAGGGLATEENLYPCFSTNPHVLYHMMVDYMPVVRDFDLDGPALTWIRPNNQTGMVFEDGSSIMLNRMVQDTKDSFKKYSFKDAVTFGKKIRQWRTIVQDIVAPATYIPPMAPIDITMAMQKTDIGRQMLDIGEMSAVDIITESFEHDKVRALLLYASCMWGLDPHETGIGFMVPLMIDRAMNKCYCYGGSHKFASALGRAVMQNGGLILESAGVNKILMEDGHVAGVTLDEGRTIKSKVVMSTLDPTTTFIDLLGPEHISEDLKDSVEGWTYDKWSFNTLHIATDDPPKYKTDDLFINNSFMNIVGFETMDQVLSHWDNVINKKLDTDIMGGHSTCESLFDPTLSDKPGKHVSMFQIHAPYNLEGTWDERNEEIKQAMLAKWEKAAPNINAETIISSSTENPEEIAIRFPQMRSGAIKHGDYKPIQMGCFRPNQECSSTDTPIDGLYVCGVSTYPGGLVLGGSGYIGANKVAEDLDVKKWWEPTPEMELYTKTYLED